MAGQLLSEVWGRHLEDELVWVEPVLTYVASHGPVDAPTDWIRGRESPIEVFSNRDHLYAFLEETWFPERVFYVRQVPALRFDTEHGSVVVTDIWGETGFGALRLKRSAGLLRIHAPLFPVAKTVAVLAGTPRGGVWPRFQVSRISFAPTEVLRPRVKLLAWSSYSSWPGGELASHPVCEWAVEPNSYQRRGVMAVGKAFLQVNDASEVQRAKALVDRRSGAPSTNPASISTAIARLERYANDER